MLQHHAIWYRRRPTIQNLLHRCLHNKLRFKRHPIGARLFFAFLQPAMTVDGAIGVRVGSMQNIVISADDPPLCPLCSRRRCRCLQPGHRPKPPNMIRWRFTMRRNQRNPVVGKLGSARRQRQTRTARTNHTHRHQRGIINRHRANLSKHHARLFDALVAATTAATATRTPVNCIISWCQCQSPDAPDANHIHWRQFARQSDDRR